MSSKKRTATQARKDRAALKRLRKSGTYSGKIDLRKAPTKYQLKKIAELKTKKPSKSKQPLSPNVKTPGVKIKKTRLSEKQVRETKPSEKFKLVTYALPFRRKGKQEDEWRRFTHKQLIQFLNEYKDDDQERAEWRSYAVREDWTFESKEQKMEFRDATDLYFSGVRISEPKGGFSKVHANQHTKRKAEAKKTRKRKA